MTFWKAIFLLVRQRSVAVPVLALSVGAALVSFLALPTPYTAEAVAVLTTQTTGTSSQGPDRPPVLTNPLLNFDSSLQTAVVILVQSMSAPERLVEIGAGLSSGTSVTITDGSSDVRFLATNGPFIVFKGTSGSPEDAQKVVLQAEQGLRQELMDRQRALDAPQATYIDLIEVLPVSPAVAHPFEKVQTAGGVLVLMLVLGTAAAYGWFRIRAVRPRASPTEGTDPSGPGAPAAETASEAPPTGGPGGTGSPADCPPDESPTVRVGAVTPTVETPAAGPGEAAETRPAAVVDTTVALPEDASEGHPGGVDGPSDGAVATDERTDAPAEVPVEVPVDAPAEAPAEATAGSVVEEPEPSEPEVGARPVSTEKAEPVRKPRPSPLPRPSPRPRPSPVPVGSGCSPTGG